MYELKLSPHVSFAGQASLSAPSVAPRAASVEGILLYSGISNTKLHQNGWEPHLPSDQLV